MNEECGVEFGILVLLAFKASQAARYLSFVHRLHGEIFVLSPTLYLSFAVCPMQKSNAVCNADRIQVYSRIHKGENFRGRLEVEKPEGWEARLLMFLMNIMTSGIHLHLPYLSPLLVRKAPCSSLSHLPS